LDDPTFRGARILELGGSGEATRGFLHAGAARIDQVDVSPGMHEWARARLTADERARVVQHTTPAERLPFADATFDGVFSRHCVHHMRRPDALREAARVLQPDGWLLILEPYLPRAVRPAVALRRRLRGGERGTDDPLGPRDLRTVRSLFREVRTGGEPTLNPYVRDLPHVGRLVLRAEHRLGLPAALLPLLGGRIFVLARRPRGAGR
ncbi:MAG TPA: class I SAM-dependent methyltransferase, partial [Sandaracinaceae bacterium LLY-WYZ-13_1]|nr:class I SAM-dependent methyltransferase [Sandaracinaceae bacterium LLY-WYZ-13_1]